MSFYKKSPLENTYQAIKQRCYNKNNKLYGLYGGRGIKVCDHWLESKENFIKDMSPKPIGKSIDRIDPNGDYSPENCRWATPKEQARNTRNTRKVIVDGKEYIAADLAERFNIKTDTLINRVNHGFSMADLRSGKKVPRYNLSKDIKKAVAANKARMAARTHCKHGHEYTKENTRITKEGWRECKVCRRKKARKYRPKVDQKKENHCINGHEYTKENTYYSTKGARLCKVCRRASKRRSARKKKNLA